LYVMDSIPQLTMPVQEDPDARGQYSNVPLSMCNWSV
jgi:hypothetical protein